MRHLRWILPLLILLAAGLSWALWPGGPSGEPTRVLVVLDTVRADHLSACGYDRPTTPRLEELVDRGARIHCAAVSPGGWTLPSHASFFTGAMPVEHKAHCITSGAGDLSGSGARARPLNQDLPTLAEQMEARGYQAHLVSTNPVVSEAMGLTRGFRSSTVSERWGQYFGEQLPPLLRKTLAQVDREQGPLFLVVNIADAHQPWRSVAEDLDHAEPTRAMPYSKTNEAGVWRRYVEGRVGEQEADLVRERATNLYDNAVFTADQNLGALIDALEDGGWCESGCQVVVTSDHGEFLGEHGLLDHGHYVWDENVVVPLLVWGFDDVELPEGPISALQAHDLVLEGRLGERPVLSESWPHIRRCARTEGKAFCDTSVALWDERGKRVWLNGEQFAEQDGVRTPIAPDPELAALGEAVKLDERDDHAIDEDVLKLLRAAGYVD